MAVTILNAYVPKGSDKLSVFVDGLSDDIKAIQAMYPIGIILPFTSDVDPNTTIGGRWNRVSSGVTLMTAGFNDQWYDGDTYHNDAFSRTKMRGGQLRHCHLTAMGFDGNLAYCLLQNGNPIFNSAVKGDCMGFNIQKSYDIIHTQVRVAYTREQSSLPPFYTCYMWERVA